MLKSQTPTLEASSARPSRRDSRSSSASRSRSSLMLRWRSPISRRVRTIGPTISPPASRVRSRIGQAAAERPLQPPAGAAASVPSAPGSTIGTEDGIAGEAAPGLRADPGQRQIEPRGVVDEPRRGHQRVGALGRRGVGDRPDQPGGPGGVRADGELQARRQHLDLGAHRVALGEIGQRAALALGEEAGDEDGDQRESRRQVCRRPRPGAAPARRSLATLSPLPAHPPASIAGRDATRAESSSGV